MIKVVNNISRKLFSVNAIKTTCWWGRGAKGRGKK
jgi:hypothetical protein